MQQNEIKQELIKLEELYRSIFTMLDFEHLQSEVKRLDALTYESGFWDQPDAAQKIIKKLKMEKTLLDKLMSFKTLYDDIIVLSDFALEDNSILNELEQNIQKFERQFDSLSIELLLSNEFDDADAVLEIHPGAGGTESQDWADMLFRMYRRYGEQKGLEFELLDYQDGEEAGLKSVTFILRGDYSYGYLKAEHGVHRLVRISPFDSGGRRHTSFASVNVIPQMDENVELEILEKDLKIDTYRSSGAGGQSVNTTDSAVRITHLPTKTVVCVQNERSQIKNRDKAMQILKSKLYQQEQIKKQEELSQYRSTGVSNSFGSQIRSYVMHPYSMVKDHRTNEETGNVQKVLDGDIDAFIIAYLKEQTKGEEHE